MKRAMIVGQPGASKSTLARAIGQCTGLPVVHIDCPERLDPECLRWIRGTPHTNRRRARALIDRAGARHAILPGRPRAVRRFLRDLDSGLVPGQ